MAYYSKDVYDKKQMWAERRMTENAENNNLTEEQHDCLARLCAFRHKLHTNQGSAFNTESSLYDEFSKEISCYEEDGITEEAEQLFGCKPFNRIDYYTEQDIEDELEECEDDEEREQQYKKLFDEYFFEAAEKFEQVNNQIENFLCKVDKQYGTNYCPTGASRIF